MRRSTCRLRALSKEKALLLDGPTGSNWLRYERMHELAFHRAYNAFVKGRETEVEPGVAPGKLNEANEGEEEQATDEEETTSVAASTPKPAASRPVVGEVTGAPIALAKAIARNEANVEDESHVTRCQGTVPVESDGDVREAGPVTVEGSGPVAREEETPPSSNL